MTLIKTYCKLGNFSIDNIKINIFHLRDPLFYTIYIWVTRLMNNMLMNVTQSFGDSK